jgi:hypothetical protein
MTTTVSNDEASKEELRSTEGSAAAKAVFLAILDGDLQQLITLNALLGRPSGKQCGPLIDECRAFIKALAPSERVSVTGVANSTPTGPAVWSLEFVFWMNDAKYSLWVNVRGEAEAVKSCRPDGDSYYQSLPADAGDVLSSLQCIVKTAVNNKLIKRYT